ncbi:hypothetical protein [Streptomyces exfoliatus]|uniref:hypothetical protein n=1 Tax=Streptomyces exfoliatus TaxID=1905 RepID=UPI000463095B|nr:hypothetical protein [Streptomyces exfoliatus]
MRPVILSSLVRYAGRDRISRWRPEPISVDVAWRCIRQAYKAADAVQVHVTTDRDGNSFHVVHVCYGPGHWDKVRLVTDIYEIPSDALTDL